MFKLVNSVVQNRDQEEPAVQQMMKQKDWREDLSLKVTGDPKKCPPV